MLLVFFPLWIFFFFLIAHSLQYVYSRNKILISINWFQKCGDLWFRTLRPQPHGPKSHISTWDASLHITRTKNTVHRVSIPTYQAPTEHKENGLMTTCTWYEMIWMRTNEENRQWGKDRPSRDYVNLSTIITNEKMYNHWISCHLEPTISFKNLLYVVLLYFFLSLVKFLIQKVDKR